MTQEERISNLEKRMSTLEQTLKDGRKNLNKIVDDWENVIFELSLIHIYSYNLRTT